MLLLFTMYHCSNWIWVVEEILAFGNGLRSTHCREFNYLKLCRPAYFVITTQLLTLYMTFGLQYVGASTYSWPIPPPYSGLSILPTKTPFHKRVWRILSNLYISLDYIWMEWFPAWVRKVKRFERLDPCSVSRRYNSAFFSFFVWTVTVGHWFHSVRNEGWRKR